MNNNFLVILNLLRSDGSIILNKSMAHSIGINETIIYSELLSKYKYFAERNMLDEDGYFYNTLEDLEKDTALTNRQQTPAINKLMKLKLIDKCIKGIPAKRYFKIYDNFNLIMKYLKHTITMDCSQIEQNVKTSFDKKSNKVLTKSLTNNTNNKTNFNNTNTTTSKKPVVVADSFINNFIQEFKEKYNCDLHKKRLKELYVLAGEEEIKKYFDNFDKFIKSCEIDDIPKFFYTAVKEKYSIPKNKKKKSKINKPSQATNYESREYPEEFFEQFYENLRSE